MTRRGRTAAITHMRTGGRVQQRGLSSATRRLRAKGREWSEAVGGLDLDQKRRGDEFRKLLVVEYRRSSDHGTLKTRSAPNSVMNPARRSTVAWVRH